MKIKKEDILFHPSSFYKAMTDPLGAGITEKQLKTIDEFERKGSTLTDKQFAELERLIMKRDAPPELSETCKKYLIEVYVQIRYGRKQDITNKYIKKGLHTEEDAITLLSRVKGVVYNKNTERLTNRYFTGEPDLYDGKSIMTATNITDTKSCWDLFTYNNAKYINKVNNIYDWQGVGYMDLTVAEQFTLAYCLVDLPPIMLSDMKRRLAWDMGVIDTEADEAYQEACLELDKGFNYDDIPMEKRVHEIVIERDVEKIVAAHERIKICRDWMWETFDWT